MKKSKLSDSQIIAILKKAEDGTPVPNVCREHGISSATFYKWRSKFGGDGQVRHAVLVMSKKSGGEKWLKVAVHDQMLVIAHDRISINTTGKDLAHF